MKKKILYFAIYSTAIALISCTKSYTCDCTDGTNTVVFSEDIIAKNKNEAREKCRIMGDECGLREH